ncbi:MAG: tetratricopeptide repeat protein [Vicinamibacteria bacterium]
MDENPRIAELRKKLEKDPGSRLFAQLAEELRKEGRFVDAIGVCRKGLEKNPNYPSARLTLARALLDSGSPQEAQVELDQIVKASPDNILAGRLLGDALEDLGQITPALRQFEKTLRLAPGDRGILDKISDLKLRLAAAAFAPPPLATVLPAAAPAVLSAISVPDVSVPEVSPPPFVFDKPAAAPILPPPAARPPSPMVSEALDRDLSSGTLSPGSLNIAELMHFEATHSPSEVSAAVTDVTADEDPEIAATIGFGHAETIAFSQIPELAAVDLAQDLPLEGPLPEVFTTPEVVTPPEVFTTEEMSPEPAPDAPMPEPVGALAYPPLADDDPDVGSQTLPLTSMTLADLYLQQGLKAEASAVLSQVLKEEPENAQAQSRFDAVSSQLATEAAPEFDEAALSMPFSEPEVIFTSPEAAEFDSAIEPMAPPSVLPAELSRVEHIATPVASAQMVEPVSPTPAPVSRPRSRAEIHQNTIVSLKALLSAVEREAIQQRATERGAY